MNDVTVVLNGYKRPHTLLGQYHAIKNQTYKNIDIILWINLVDGIGFDPFILHQCDTIISQRNYGVWGRFAAALNAQTPFINIIDDDTIPGCEWIENCLNTISKYDGIITTRGVIIDKENSDKYPLPDSYKAYGWCNPNEEVTKVDFGCHSWFINKSLLKAFWLNSPIPSPMDHGEDIHLSFIAQKYFGVGTYVAPHPKDNMNMWGSMPDKGTEYGSDKEAISWNPNANYGMNQYLNFVRSNGFKIINEDSNEIHSSTK